MSTAQQKFLARNAIVCRKCGKPKTNNGKHAWCKPCQAEYYQERCKTPGYREKLVQKSKEWAAKNRDRATLASRKSGLKREFGITIEQYDAMHAAQNGLCKICGQPECFVNRSGKVQRLAVDHCHKTGINRGLLCAKCNHAIERIENISDWCAKARAYLDETRNHPPIKNLP
jgi:hypothetical protein